MNEVEFLKLTVEQRKERRYVKWLDDVYASKRRIQRRFLALERDIAQSIQQYKICEQQSEWFGNYVAFLSCWKFSKVDFGKTTFWCDAIYLDEFKMAHAQTFMFSGHAWIGLTDHVGHEWKVPCSGKFTINASGKKLKSYDLYFYDKARTIHLFKKI